MFAGDYNSYRLKTVTNYVLKIGYNTAIGILPTERLGAACSWCSQPVAILLTVLIYSQ